jgi:hypothetical protein
MARIKIADCVAVADRIANDADPQFSPDVRPFTLFSLDMTECRLNADGWPLDMRNGPVMQRYSGQKESDRRLWRIEPTSPERVAAIESNERAERLAKLESFYANGGESAEFDVPDYVTFATNLAEACHRILGEAPTFLLDDDGEADIY